MSATDGSGHPPRHQKSCAGEWNGLPVWVTAYLVPRYGYTTASINLFVGGKEVLKTGGVAKATGELSKSFLALGTEHVATVSWGAGGLRSFPVVVTIDAARVADGPVAVHGWPIALWPFVAVVGVVALAIGWLGT